MTPLWIVLGILGGLLALCLLLAAVVLLLPAGLDVRWQWGAPLEIWLMAGPLRRRFLPPGGQEKAERGGTGTASPEAEQTAASRAQPPAAGRQAPAPEAAAPDGGQQPVTGPSASDTEEKAPAAQPQPAASQPEAPSGDDLDDLFEKLMSNPVHYAKVVARWARGPGSFLVKRLRVRHVRIVWTVTEADAAQTAVTYGALIAACNTAWQILRDRIDLKSDDLRIEPDFVGRRSAERCFACQITAKMYIIVASIILTVNASARRRVRANRRRRAV